VRAFVQRLTLPRVAAHGDFYPGNVLVSGGVAWVVDWELCGRRPLGYDLMHYWATTEDAQARAVVLEGALDLVGASNRAELLRLRYAVAVRVAASKLAAAASGDRDPKGAQRLLRSLPELREGL
jgi:aminoglycoside phosphotransferase (APT) family kinase protein